MSSALWWLVLGLLVGWLIEWAIDWIYWRRPRQRNEVETQETRQATAELARMRDALASARTDNERLQAERNSATALAEQRQLQLDELAEQLASLQTAETQRAHGLQHDAAGEREHLASLQTSETHPPTDTAAPQSHIVLGVDHSAVKAESKATIQLSHDELAALLPSADVAASSEPQTRDALTLQERQVSHTAPQQRDPLIDINGIGPAYERKLFDAGVSTFEDLAALTAEQVRAIIEPQSWQAIDPAAWIDEARQLAQKKAQQ